MPKSGFPSQDKHVHQINITHFNHLFPLYRQGHILLRHTPSLLSWTIKTLCTTEAWHNGIFSPGSFLSVAKPDRQSSHSWTVESETEQNVSNLDPSCCDSWKMISGQARNTLSVSSSTPLSSKTEDAFWRAANYTTDVPLFSVISLCSLSNIQLI